MLQRRVGGRHSCGSGRRPHSRYPSSRASWHGPLTAWRRCRVAWTVTPVFSG